MIRELITLVEEKSKDDKLSLNKLPYKKTELAPVLSKDTLDYHYSELAAGYVKRYNNDEGDLVFNEAGAYLHNTFFPQLMPPKTGNKPTGACEALINKKYGSFNEFKEEFAEVAMKIQGSGWVYMSRSGDIKTIKNHQVKKDIANKNLADIQQHRKRVQTLFEYSNIVSSYLEIDDADGENKRQNTTPRTVEVADAKEGDLKEYFKNNEEEGGASASGSVDYINAIGAILGVNESKDDAVEP